MDGDTGISKPKEYVQERLANETELNKIIAFNYRGAYTGIQYKFLVDANLNCFAQQSMDRYLPYSILKDDQAWLLSQAEIAQRSNIQEPFVFKIYPEILLWNPAHNNEYPRDYKEGIEELDARRKREGYSEGCRCCFHQEEGKVANCTLQGHPLWNVELNSTHRYWSSSIGRIPQQKNHSRHQEDSTRKVGRYSRARSFSTLLKKAQNSSANDHKKPISCYSRVLVSSMG